MVMPGVLVLAQEAEPLTGGVAALLLGMLLVAAVATLAVLRLVAKGLGALLWRWARATGARSTAAERRLLGTLAVTASVLTGSSLAASTGSFTSVAGQLVASAAQSLFLFLYLGPIVLLLSASFRLGLTAQILRTADTFRIPWRTWGPIQRWIAIPINLVLVGPFAWPVAGMRTAVPYLRGDYDDGVDARVPWPLQPGPSPTGSATNGRPLPAPTGPRHDQEPAPQPRRAPDPEPLRSGADRREADRPARRPKDAPRTAPTARADARREPRVPPQGDEARPRRRWWQSADREDAGPTAAKEPKFRTRSGGDGQTQVSARRKRQKDSDGEQRDFVEIAIDAPFRVPRAGSLVVTVLEFLDVTDPGRGPVDVHRRTDSTLGTGGPYRVEEKSKVPHANARLALTMGFDLRSFRPPFRGERTIRAQFSMHRPRSPEEKLALGWVEFPLLEEAPGYVEAPRIRLRAEAGIVTAGFAAVIADDDIDADELALLTEFLAERHRKLPDGERLADAARAALDDARLRSRSGTTARELLVQAGRDLADAEKGPRATAYELAVRIMAVDGRITPAELMRLNELAEVLELDPETTATLRNRHTKVGMFEGDDADPLGVPPGTPQEQRAFLMGERKKWRGVLTHPDPAKQEQAQEMIDLITARIADIDEALGGTR